MCHIVLLIEPRVAPKHHFDPHLIVDAISLFNLVFDQLFSNGLERLTASDYIWSSTSCCVDDWMSIGKGGAISDMEYSTSCVQFLLHRRTHIVDHICHRFAIM
jgi:hypothetical protein